MLAYPLRTIAILANCLFCAAQIFGQSTIQGTVVGKNDQPLAAASVSLLRSADSVLVKGMLTTTTGHYDFEKISPGSYIILISHTGFKEIYSPSFILAAGENKTVATQKLSENVSSMNAVTVTARKPLFEQRVDRMVINVATNITASGGTVLDVLERSPGIIVDRQNNAISINGKNGVVVMINGRINHMPLSALVQMLAGMPADNVEKIELITTPPANFDAEGDAGFINIVLKRNDQWGTNGSYALTPGYSKGWVTTANGNINHREAKWNLYGNYSIDRRASEQQFTFYHASDDQGKFSQNFSDSHRDPVETISDLKIGFDYDLKKNLVIGTLVDLFDRGWNMTAHNTSSVYINNQLDTTVEVLLNEKHPLNSYDLNLNLQQTYADGKLALNIDYLNYREKNPVSYVNSYYDAGAAFLYEEHVRSDKNTPVHVSVATVDYENKLGAKTRISAGLKTTISEFTNAVEVDNLVASNWTADPALTATYFLNENISAAYSGLEWSISTRTKFKSGLRFEYTNSNLKTATVKNIVDRHYGKLFPSLFLSHSVSDDQSIAISYSRRITRPTFWNLAPFVIFMDPNTFFSGNPGLQPAITDNLNASYSYKRKILTIAYSHESSPIANFSPHVEQQSNKETFSAENQRSLNTINASVSLPFDVTKWWNVQLNLNGSYIESHGIYNKEEFVLRQENLFANALQNFKLPRAFTFSVSSIYISPGLFGLYNTKPLGSLDLGLQKKFKDQKSSLRINFSDVLNTLKFRWSVNLPEKNLVSSSEIQTVHPAFRVTFTHSFGSEKVKAKRERSTGAEDEKLRLKI